jgi:hypothetical protein
LECKRQTLYEEEEPIEEFLEWAKLPEERRSDKPPPLTTCIGPLVTLVS